MLEIAKENLKEYNITLVCDNVINLKPTGNFDVAVSSLVYHHLEGEEKKVGYQKVFDALKQGGIFVLADVVGSSDPHLNKQLEEHWSEYMLKIRGVEFRDKILNEAKNQHKPSSLDENLTYLKSTGFKPEVYWRYMKTAILYCIK